MNRSVPLCAPSGEPLNFDGSNGGCGVPITGDIRTWYNNVFLPRMEGEEERTREGQGRYWEQCHNL